MKLNSITSPNGKNTIGMTTVPHRQPTRKRVQRVVQQHQPRQQQRMTKADTSFAATMVKFIVVAFLAYALVPMSVLHWLEKTL